MNILKYLLSRSYRQRFNAEYTKDICDKLSTEENQKQDIYETILGKNTNI
jgi:hypothetical protein